MKLDTEIESEFKPGITVRETLELWEKYARTDRDEEAAEPLTVDVSGEGVLLTHIGDRELDPPQQVQRVTYRPDQYLDIETDAHKFRRCYAHDIRETNALIREHHTGAELVTVLFRYQDF